MGHDDDGLGGLPAAALAPEQLSLLFDQAKNKQNFVKIYSWITKYFGGSDPVNELQAEKSSWKKLGGKQSWLFGGLMSRTG